MLDDIAAAGASLVAVSPQSPDNSLSTAEKQELRFAVVTDSGNEVARAYGLAFRLPDSVRSYFERVGNDLAAANGDDRWELPIPATYVVGRDGVVCSAYVDPDYRRRLDPHELVAAVRAAG